MTPAGPRSHPRRPRRRAFTLLEALVLLTVFTIVAIGVSVGLQAAADTTAATDRALAISTELISEAEAWRAIAFTGAAWPASVPYTLTDTVTMSIGGGNRTFNRTTTIKNWDPANLTTNASPQSNFVQLQITIDGQTLTVYLCNLT